MKNTQILESEAMTQAYAKVVSFLIKKIGYDSLMLAVKLTPNQNILVGFIFSDLSSL